MVKLWNAVQLSMHPEVSIMLRSAEYGAIKTDYEQIKPGHSFQEQLLPGRHEVRSQRCALPTLWRNNSFVPQKILDKLDAQRL